MTDQSNDLPPKRKGVDPEDIRRALEEQLRNRPARPPVFEMLPPIPKLRVDKPRNRSRRKKKP